MVRTNNKPLRRRGAALMMTLFLVFMVSTLVLNIVQTETLQLAGTRNSIEYERSLYWANAGVHDASARLAIDASWRGTATDGVVPPATPANGYSATAVDDAAGNVVVTSIGYAGNGVRSVQATIEL